MYCWEGHRLSVAATPDTRHHPRRDPWPASRTRSSTRPRRTRPRRARAPASPRRVAEIVRECSDTDATPKPPWRERKIAYLGHVPAASAEAVRVSLADKLHNARAVLCVRLYEDLGVAAGAPISIVASWRHIASF